ncbi:MAG: DUF4055 domain-containing protein [[Pasteurella] mairii]|uniref:Putative bacteriophage protein n=1 Tax=[Pasteurella] mairii TaxID=757 RepID=A0A379B3X0_9PAST|nr:DUF4055 domain-containing protein [[Pasteurella] mairii]SUB33314.1 putative bacteriophage protein [[Pasteurella] mairii]
MSHVSTVNPEMAKLHFDVKIIDDLLGGTRTMRDAGQTYLFKMPLEDETAYRNRLSRSTLHPALAETLSQMCGRVFFKPINVLNVNEKIVNEILVDVDLEGNNLDVFAAQWFHAALAYGVSFVLVDFTRTENAKTKADEKAQGARPYLVHIPPQSVLGFKVGRINGKKQITQFRYKEFIPVDDGEFGVKTIEQINVYEIGRVRKFRLSGQGKSSDFVEVEEVGLTAQGKSLSFIPVVPFVTKKTRYFGVGQPPLMELAYLNIKHWQSQSDQDNILNTARVPLLARNGVEDDSPLKIGGSVIDLPREANLFYVEHSGASIQAGQESLKELESQMRIAGAKLLDKTVLAMTDSQARDEQGKEISALRLYANLFEDAIDLALEYVGVWLGVDQVGKVEISGNIDNDFDPNVSIDSVIKLQTSGNLSKQTTFNEAKRRGLISDNVEWEEEQARLDNEGLDHDFTGDDR